MTSLTTRPPALRLLGIAGMLLFGVAGGATAQDPAPPPAAPDTERSEALEEEGELYVAPPEIILESQAAPEYPPAARQGRFEGTVHVEFTVLEDGSVGDVTVLECTRKKLGFEDATMDAIRKWRFSPAMLGTQPVQYTSQFRFNFRYPGVTDQGFVTGGVVPPKARGAERKSERPVQDQRPPGSTGAGL